MNENINWEQRRYEIAKEMLPIMINNYPTSLLAANEAVWIADALIAELKNCPKGTKLYSILHGEVEYEGISEKDLYEVRFRDIDGCIETVKPDGRYLSCCNGECILLPSKDQRDWSKFSAPWYKKKKFNPKTLQPFDKVLAKDNGSDMWMIDFYSFNDRGYMYPYRCVGGSYLRCIPFNEETKYLVGTTDEAPEYYKYWED